MASGLELWSAPLVGAHTAVVRLEIGLGLDHEVSTGRWGQAAVLLAALRVAPTRHLPAHTLEVAALRVGVLTETTIGADSVALTVSGPAPSLGLLLWLTGQRLDALAQARPSVDDLRAALLAGLDQQLSRRGPPVSQAGGAAETVTAALLGAARGHSAFASRLAASQAQPDRLQTLGAALRADLPARVIVVASPEALGALPVGPKDYLGEQKRRPWHPKTPPRAAGRRFNAAGRVGGVAADPPPSARKAPARIDVRNPSDGSHSVLVGWALGEPTTNDQPAGVRRDADALTLSELLGHSGGLLGDRLVRGHAVARAVDVQILPHDLIRDSGRTVLPGSAPTTLLIAMEVRTPDGKDARALLVEELEALADEPPDEDLVAAAAAAAATRIERRWSHPKGRSELLGYALATGRSSLTRPPEAWWSELMHALGTPSAERLSALVGGVRDPRNRVVADVVPSRPSPSDDVVIDAALLTTYRRLMVDARCPPGGGEVELTALLRSKYGWTPKQYIATSRALARRPKLLRELSYETDAHCKEYAKLLSLASLDQIVAVHRVVACKVGRVADPDRRRVALQKALHRFDLDASLYRPLIAMAREDPKTASRLAAVDGRCPAPEERP